MNISKANAALRCGISVMSLLSAGWAAPALAQAATAREAVGAQGNEGSSDIVVTARRREENLLKVPLTITAITADQLQKSGTTGLEDLAKATPGLAFQSLGGTYQAPVIRGLAQVDQTAQIGNVGVFVDGIYLNNRSGLEFGFMDLERVEVVKGPQSAQYGRNTFSGAINYVTKAPKLDSWDGYFTSEAGNHNRFSGQGSLNIPIGNFAALRVFGGVGKFDGTITNVRDGSTLGGYKRRDNYGGTLLIKPTDKLTIKLFGMRTDTIENQAPLVYSPTATNNCGASSPGGINGARQTLFCGALPSANTVNLNDTIGSGLTGHSYLAYATADYDLDFATLTGTYGYTSASFGQINDSIGDPTAVTKPLFAGSPLSQQSYLTVVGTGSHEHSYDLKLTSPGSGPLTWMIGGYLYDSTVSDVLQGENSTLANPAILVPLFGIGKTVQIIGHALYGSAGYALADGLRFSMEGRYTDETLRFNGSNLTNGSYVTGIRGTTKYHYFTPRFSLDYQFNTRTMVYASAARGYKIGGFNANGAGLPQFEYKPETNWTYEVGIKGKLFGNKFVYTADIFYVNWMNIQTQLNIASSSITVVGNNRGATSKGVELDGTYFFTPGIWLRGSAAFLDPKYKAGTVDGEVTSYCGLLTGTTIATAGCSADVGGKQLARTTKTQFTVTGNVSIPLTDTFEGFIRADYSYQSGKSSLSLNYDDQGTISLVNARIGITSKSYELALWSRNLLDTKYLARATVVAAGTADGSTAGGVSQTRLYPGERRTFGVRGTYRF